MPTTQILLIALIGATPQQAPTHQTPQQAPTHQTPLQHRATKALAGFYGVLEPWQRRGYEAALAGKLEPRTFVVTGYFPSEGHDGLVDCRGNRCHPGVIACNRLPYGTVVALDGWERLFRVEDHGSSANDRRTRARGTWVDVWLERAGDAQGRCDWTPTRGAVVCR